jgi:transposase
MLNINNIRKAIRIKYLRPDISSREQAKLADASHQSMLRINKRCERYSVDFPLAEKLNDKELCELLYPFIEESKSNKRPIDYDGAMKELQRKKGKSKAVLYLEYRAKDPATAMSKTQFYRLLNAVWKKIKFTMRQHHIAGEVVYIDYAGTQVHYLQGGKKVCVKIFVAVLGASKKLFAFATHGEKTYHWIDGMTRMFQYFGGVTEAVSMDNARALVTKAGLIANLVQNVEAFGDYYGCLMDTCRVRAPQDKSLAELGVKFITLRILIPMMRNYEFFSIDEINRFLTAEVEKLNEGNFQGFSLSRNDLFEQIEKAELAPLPSIPFEMIVDRHLNKVPPNYHVKYLQHEYSVPYQLRGEVVEVIANQSMLKIVHQHQIVAQHVIKHEPMGATTLPDHMPVEHLADSLCNQEDNLIWATEVGSSVEEIVEQWYSKTKNPASRAIGKRCQALMKLVKRKGGEVVNDACEYALEHDMKTPSDVELIIRAHSSKPDFAQSSNATSHKNIRGKAYYGDHHEA